MARKKPLESAPLKSPDWAGGGPSIYGQLYLALATLGAIPIGLAYSAPPRPQTNWLFALLGLHLLFAFATRLLRLGVQDWHSTSALPERVFYYMIPASLFFVPAFLRGHSVVPEGFIFAGFPLLLVAVEPPQARRYVGWMLLAFWAVLYRRPDVGVEWVLGFGAATLWSLACIHFAFVGGPFGLSGWWPARRAFLSAVVYFIPAGLAAVLVWGVWPEPAPPERSAFPPPEAFAEKFQGMSGEELMRFLVQLGVVAVMVMILLIILYYFRRWLSRRMKPAAVPHIVGGDMSEIDYAARERRTPQPSLGGNRARIVRLWSRWSRRMEISAGTMRVAGETAAELDARLAPITGGESAERREIVEIFDRAHYGEGEPGAEDVKRMRELAEEKREGLQESKS